MSHRFFKTCFLALTVILFSTLISCGEQSNSNEQLVDIAVFPDTPLVFEQGFTTIVNSEEFEITGPWFLLQLAGSNQSKKRLVLVSMELEMTSSTGEVTKWSPPLDEGVVFIGTALPNQAITWMVGPDFSGGSSQLISYVDGLTQANSLNYRVKLTIAGWFTETVDDTNTPQDESTVPIESFTKTLILNARPG